MILSLDLMVSFASLDLQMINLADYKTLKTAHVKLVLSFTISIYNIYPYASAVFSMSERYHLI